VVCSRQRRQRPALPLLNGPVASIFFHEPLADAFFAAVAQLRQILDAWFVFRTLHTVHVIICADFCALVPC
jgi:hypothetical protein